jgi:glycine cleavage system H protein
MIPDNLLFTEEHEWLRLSDDGTAYIGISDFAQEQLGEVVFVELPAVGEKVVAGDEFGSIESVKASSEMYCPVSGEVLELNESLGDSPESVNQSPYDDGWMIRVKLEDLSETHGLMDSEAYAYHIKRSDVDEDVLDDLDDEEHDED